MAIDLMYVGFSVLDGQHRSTVLSSFLQGYSELDVNVPLVAKEFDQMEPVLKDSFHSWQIWLRLSFTVCGLMENLFRAGVATAVQAMKEESVELMEGSEQTLDHETP